ncbi:MAG: hypothetical protein ACKO2P_17300 [Planctomycetota bacterium]
MLPIPADILPRLTFVHEHRLRVRDLKGFRRGHAAPTEYSDHTAAFVARIAADDLSAELDERFADFRRLLRCRRTDLQVTGPEAGTAAIAAPGFEYRITAMLAEDQPTDVIWRRQLSGFTDVARIAAPELSQVFPAVFDTLEFLPLQPADPAAVIDRLEDQPQSQITLDYDRHATWCTLSFRRPAVTLRICADSVSLKLQQPAAPEVLYQLFLKLFEHVTGGPATNGIVAL